MGKKSDYVMCMISSPTTESEVIADALIRKNLGACVQITSPITSFYQWEGELHKDSEVLILVKTQNKVVRQIESLLKELHSYKVPEFIVFPIIDGLSSYLRWIDERVSG